MQRDMERIQGKVSEMAALAEGALEACLRGLLERNRQLAYSVILRDRRIDELEKEIDRLCLEFIVRQQPVARPLRFAYVTIKINQEIERIGDYAESIARQILKISTLPVPIPLERYKLIAALSIPMLRNSVQAYLKGDEALARATMVTEEEVDDLKSEINAELVQLRQEDKIPLKALTPLMTIARRFERVSDQAKNICEETLYMVTGEYQKHLGGDVWRMVFLDSHNACASQMAEAIGHSLGRPQFVFASAGAEPKSIDPDLIAFLKDKNIDIGGATSKTPEQVPNWEFTQIRVALDANAKKYFPSGNRAVCLDWALPDLSQAGNTGSAEQKTANYEAAYQFLREHISALVDAVLSDKIS